MDAARIASRTLTALLVLVVTATLAATVGPLLLPYRTYAVMSGSMAPQIPVGALVVDLPAAPSEVRPGDVITFTRPDNGGQLVTHRIVAMAGGSAVPAYRTKGDANSAPDPWQVPAGGRVWRVAAQVPLAGYALGWLRSPGGQLLTFVLPALALGILLLVDLWRRPAPARGPA